MSEQFTTLDLINSVYKPQQCTDVNDCEIAIAQLKTYQNIYKRYYWTIQRKIDGLNKRIGVLKSKTNLR